MRKINLVLSLIYVFFLVLMNQTSAAVLIENFEDGQVLLQSYSILEDQEPNAWRVTNRTAYQSIYSLALLGNTWKTQTIPATQVSHNTVWQIAIFVNSIGEQQSFGLSDGINELKYTFRGTEVIVEDEWRIVYQGIATIRRWKVFLLPAGDDWYDTYGYEPNITSLFYINDNDGISSNGIVAFDEIYDVTLDQPIEPQVQIDFWQGAEDSTYSFLAHVYDPDSPSHDIFWEFGDGDTASGAFTTHTFAPLTYTVGVSATDQTERIGYDTALVACGPDTGSVSVNFAGDVMLARGYEQPGGIIPTYGVEYIFEPTLDVLGNAADMSSCNLECPLTDTGTPHPTKSIVFRGHPENVAGITYSGIDVAINANNHIYDYLELGLAQTIQVLDSAGIRHAGAGLDLYEAIQPAFLSHEGVRIAFLGYNDRNGIQYNEQPFFYAGYSKAGALRSTEQYFSDAITDARNASDIVIVQIHCGEEYSSVPIDSLKDLQVFEDYVRFPTAPDSNAFTLKYSAIDHGADLVIGHHPHVLQGFEVYQGKVIAHSLGNFVFDLSYFETFPSMIVSCRIDRTGVFECSFVPIFIDDWIPRPALGSLARNIIRRIADYSREMGCVIVANPEMSAANICLDTTELVESHIELSNNVLTYPSAAFYVSCPWTLPAVGDISCIDSVKAILPLSNIEVRVGKDVLWFGGFELEGATLWNLNSSDEWLDSTIFLQGERSLALRRKWNSTQSVYTDLTNRPPIESEKEHTLAGWIKTDNGHDAMFKILYYTSRYAGTPISTELAGAPVTGTQDWTFYTNDLDVPGNAGWINIQCTNDKPQSDTGYAWFDEIALIEWTDWMSLDEPIEIAYPNNFTHVQVRTTTSVKSVTVFAQSTSLALTHQVRHRTK